MDHLTPYRGQYRYTESLHQAGQILLIRDVYFPFGQWQLKAHLGLIIFHLMLVITSVHFSLITRTGNSLSPPAIKICMH